MRLLELQAEGDGNLSSINFYPAFGATGLHDLEEYR